MMKKLMAVLFALLLIAVSAAGCSQTDKQDETAAAETKATAAMQEVGLKPNTFYRRVKDLNL